MLLFVSSIKLISEVALMALAAQWLLGVLAGRKREGNLFYSLLQVVTKPVVRGVRVITPPMVLDRHVPLAAFVLLSMVWVFVTLAKIDLCLRIGVQSCQ